MCSHGPLNTAPACSGCRAARSWLGRMQTLALSAAMACFVIHPLVGYTSSQREVLGLLWLAGLLVWYALRPFVVSVQAWAIRFAEYSPDQKWHQCSHCRNQFLSDDWSNHG